MEEINTVKDAFNCLDLKWIIGTVLTASGILIAFLSLREKKKKSFTKSVVGSTMVRYYSKRKDANEEISEKLKKVKNEIFIAGIGLTTISGILNRSEIISHLVELINIENSNFKINIIGCDTVENAKRPFQEQEKINERITEGKKFLNDFISNISSDITGKKLNNINKFIQINNYPDKIIPRHLIIAIDKVIYVGSYMANTLGRESYTLKLVDEESKDNHNSGLYNLFEQEINLLKENCTETYNLKI